MNTEIAQCNCGQLSVTVTSEPDRVSVCHCLSCKRRTGSAFSYNATYAESKVSIDGAYASYIRATDSGNENTFRFCQKCGSTVFYEVGIRPGMISIPAGAFASASFPPPGVELYTERRQEWCEVKLGGDDSAD